MSAASDTSRDVTARVSAAVEYSHEFVRSVLDDGARRILEIGCGDGDLAALLAADGHELIAIDSDPEAVERALSKKVDARLMTWPAPLPGETFDAILFTRSLHHISNLQAAVAQAKNSLNPDGLLIIEDHRTEGGTPRSSLWYFGLCDLLVGSGAAAGDAEKLHRKISVEPDEHELHSSDQIAEALRRNFSAVQRTGAAYYFRYLEPCLVTPRAAQLLLRHELDLISADAIDALGVRFVARRATIGVLANGGAERRTG